MPFRLEDVRLLEGPFRDAMIRDQEYLLSLDAGWAAAQVPPDRRPAVHGGAARRVGSAGRRAARPRGRPLPLGRLDHVCEHRRRAVQGAGRQPGGEFAIVQAAESKKFHPGYLSAFPEELFDRVDARQRVWAPYYTIHKIMAGLLDAHLADGNAQALDVLKRQADWVVRATAA